MKKTRPETDAGKASSLSETMADRNRPRVPNLKLVKSRRGVASHSKAQMSIQDPSEQTKAKARAVGRSDRRGQEGRGMSRSKSFDNSGLAKDLEEFMYTFLQFHDRVSQLGEPKPMGVAGERCASVELGNAFDLSGML